MSKSRSWLLDFHSNVLLLFKECWDLAYSLRSADFQNDGECSLLLRQIRSLTELCNDIDAEIIDDVDDAMEYFRLAHINRHTNSEVVKGRYASYHDLAFNESEELLVFLRSSDMVGTGIVPDDGPRTILAEVVTEIASSSLFAKLDDGEISAQLQLESVLAAKLFTTETIEPPVVEKQPVKGQLESVLTTKFGTSETVGPPAEETQPVKRRYKPKACPNCKSTKTKVSSTKKAFRYIVCKECNTTWKVTFGHESMN